MADEIKDADWDKVYEVITQAIQVKLKNNEQLSTSVNWKEGQQWVYDLASRISYDVHRVLDKDFDA